MKFYVDALQELVASGKLNLQASTLVVAGGLKDRAALLEVGFSNVTISNLDTRMHGDEFAPFRWALIDAENIAFDDGAFDQVIDHMGLHHCGSPHRALLEMYRVAGRAIVVFENRDSWTLKIATKLGLVPLYELDAVRGNAYKFGGFRNTSVPNFVYRWTEREVIKTVSSADPMHKIEYQFFYHLRYPSERINEFSGLRRTVLRMIRYPFIVYASLFPKQANEFGFFVDKASRSLQPWIDRETMGLSDRLDRSYPRGPC